MSETLTYDPTPETEVLSADEQNSLEVGEQLMNEHEALLAGKYKSAQELEKAYIELQRKLGEGGEPETDESSEEVESEEADDETDEETPAVSLINEASAEYEENGQLSEETLAKFNNMSSQDLVKAYMEMSSQQSDTEQASPITESDVSAIKKTVGGEEAYTQIMQWASQNLEQSAIDGFDALVSSGNTKAIQLAVAGIKAQYEMSNGYEGRMLQGKPSESKSDTFRSQAELVQAMSDPRYDRDPAYRQDILDKLDRSDLNF